MGSIKGYLVSLVLPLVVGLLASTLTQASKRAVRWIDAQHPAVKQALALAWSAALAALVKVAGHSVCSDGGAVCALDGVDWKAVLLAAYAVSVSAHGLKGRAPARE